MLHPKTCDFIGVGSNLTSVLIELERQELFQFEEQTHAVNLNILQVNFEFYSAKIMKKKAANGPILEVANLIARPG